MIEVSAATQAALEQRQVTIRDLVWFTVRDRDTGNPFSTGYWSDVGAVSAQVVNPQTGGTEARTFAGAGSLIQIGAIPRASVLTVQTVNMVLSQVANANDLVRAYDAKQAGVEIYRALFNRGTLVQIDPAEARFVGYIDDMTINTPAEGGEGSIELTLTSSAYDLTRSNHATRSDVFQRQRNPADTGRRHVATVGTWDLKWGAR